MRVGIYSVAFVGWLCAVQAFAPPNGIGTRKIVVDTSQLFVQGTGWDNDNFLDSLGGSSEEQNEANDAYFEMSRLGRPDEQGGFPSASQLQNEAQDGFSPPYAQQYTEPQQPPSQSTNMPQPPPSPFGQQQQQQPMQQPTQSQANNPMAQQLALQQQIQQLQQQQQQMMQQQLQQQQQQQQSAPPGTFPPPAQENGAPPHPMEQQNDLPNRDIDGAVLTEDMKAQMKASHTPTEDESQGGQLFRGMMQRAKQRAAASQQQQSSMQPQQAPVQIPPNAMDLSMDEQARLFREIMAQRQQEQVAGTPNPYQQQQPQQIWDPNSFSQQQQPQGASTNNNNNYAQQQLPTYPYGDQAPAPQFLSPGTGYDGRRMGRNKDADIISTAADVYMAQLKVDSSSRRLARDAGDTTKSNKVFHDPKIQEIKAPVNPYLKEQRDRDMLESVPEEMVVFQEYNPQEDDTKRRSYSGISFKEQLAQRKAQKGNTNSNSPSGN